MDLGEDGGNATRGAGKRKPRVAHPRLVSLAVCGLLAAPPIVVTVLKIARMDDAEWGGPLVATLSVAFILVIHGFGPLMVSQGVLLLIDRERHERSFRSKLERFTYGPEWFTSLVRRHLAGFLFGNAVRGILLGLVVCVISYGIAFS